MVKRVFLDWTGFFPLTCEMRNRKGPLVLRYLVTCERTDCIALAQPVFNQAPHKPLTHASCHSLASQGDRSENLRISMEFHARNDEVRDWKDQPADDEDLSKAIEIELAKMEFNGEVEFACREASPQAWAESRIKVADKYLELVDAAERKANMEKVIAHYLAAAEVLTKEEFPERWADIQMSLCDAYLQRVEGVRRENMENAMKCFNAYQEVRGDDTLPADWLKQQWAKGAEARRRDADAMTV
jgi:hypothetical protein